MNYNNLLPKAIDDLVDKKIKGVGGKELLAFIRDRYKKNLVSQLTTAEKRDLLDIVEFFKKV